MSEHVRGMGDWTLSELGISLDQACALSCLFARDQLCQCRCGGKNHGIRRELFKGHFCEECDKFLGLDDPWAQTPTGVLTAYGCGSSEKYVSRSGARRGLALYCKECKPERAVA